MWLTPKSTRDKLVKEMSKIRTKQFLDMNMRAKELEGKKVLHIPRENLIRDMERSNFEAEKFSSKKFLFSFYEGLQMQPLDAIEIITAAILNPDGTVIPEKREILWK